jgi:hypothetical protein
MTSIASTPDRPNAQLASAVDIALDLQTEYGRRAAARFLDVAGASFATTVRVLSEPDRRRPPRARTPLDLPPPAD